MRIEEIHALGSRLDAAAFSPERPRHLRTVCALERKPVTAAESATSQPPQNKSNLAMERNYLVRLSASSCSTARFDDLEIELALGDLDIAPLLGDFWLTS